MRRMRRLHLGVRMRRLYPCVENSSRGRSLKIGGNSSAWGFALAAKSAKTRSRQPAIHRGLNCYFFFATHVTFRVTSIICRFLRLVKYNGLLLSVFLFWKLSNTGNKIKIDNFQSAGISLDEYTVIINFLDNSLYAAVI